jgi:hypothetical protein
MNRPIARIDRLGLVDAADMFDGTESSGTWGGAIGQFWDWVTGDAPEKRIYGPETPEALELSEAPNSKRFEQNFLELNRNLPCEHWEGLRNEAASQENLITDLFRGGTISFVGSFTASAEILGYHCDWAESPGNGEVTVRFRAWNKTSLTSGTYKIWPDGTGILPDLNVPYVDFAPNLPMHNYEQEYFWEKKYSCKCPCRSGRR